MAAMNPILRLRQVFRPMGAEEEQADEVADAIGDHSYSRRESDLRFERLLAEMQQQTAEMREMMIAHRRELLIEIIVIVGVAVAILALVN